MSRTGDALGFAAITAIEDGELDDHLDQLTIAIRQRQQLYDMRRPPPKTPTMIENGQVWVGMNGPGRRHWEVRGTGVVIDSDPVGVPPRFVPEVTS